MKILHYSVTNFNKAGIPTPTFTTQPASSIYANTEATYTTQTGMANYTWNIPGVLNSDFTIISGGIGTTSNTVTVKWLTAGSKTVTVNYSENGGTPTVISGTGLPSISASDIQFQASKHALPVPIF